MYLQEKSLSMKNSVQPHRAGLASDGQSEQEEETKKDDMICVLLIQLAQFTFLFKHRKAKTS